MTSAGREYLKGWNAETVEIDRQGPDAKQYVEQRIAAIAEMPPIDRDDFILGCSAKLRRYLQHQSEENA